MQSLLMAFGPIFNNASFFFLMLVDCKDTGKNPTVDKGPILDEKAHQQFRLIKVIFYKKVARISWLHEICRDFPIQQKGQFLQFLALFFKK